MKKRLTPKQRLRRDLRKQKKREKRLIEVNVNKDLKSKYQTWSKSVKERDNYVCQVCQKSFKYAKPQSIQSAHILSKENYPELMYDLNNGLVLCFRDHKNSSISSHLDGFAFTQWFKEKFPDRYEYLVNKLKELKEKKESPLLI